MSAYALSISQSVTFTNLEQVIVTYTIVERVEDYSGKNHLINKGARRICKTISNDNTTITRHLYGVNPVLPKTDHFSYYMYIFALQHDSMCWCFTHWTTTQTFSYSNGRQTSSSCSSSSFTVSWDNVSFVVLSCNDVFSERICFSRLEISSCKR